MRMRVRNKALWNDEITPLEQENLRAAYEAALEGIVLLENDGCLPLEPGKIALYGAGAGMTIKGGTGSGEVNERHVVSILEGMEMAGFKVTTRRWIDIYEEFYHLEEEEYGKAFRKKVLSLNKDSIMDIMSNPFQHPIGPPVTHGDVLDSETDTCIYVVARQAGEGGDRRLERNEYSLSPIEKETIAFCAERYEKMILVINVGSVFDMSFLDEISGINAVVYFCQQGTMGGKAFADLISGKVTPSGKLADTWAMRYEDIPYGMEYSYLNGNLAEEYYKEGIYVGYRYFDSFGVEPRYPFGYGLSYTEFALQTGAVSAENLQVTVTVDVTNVGKQYAGKEVVQVYISCPQSDLPKEYQTLSAFAKTKLLKMGETQRLELTFNLNDVASYRECDGAMVLDAGKYLVRVGTSSKNTKVAAVLHLDQELITQKLTHICQNENQIEEIVPASISMEEVPADVPVIEIRVCDFETTEYQYETPAVYSSVETNMLLEGLTLKELIALTVGDGFGTGSYFQAPGAAGVTNGKLLKKGIPNVCLADGPAGLRLQKRSAVTKSGTLKPVDPYISLMKYIPDSLKKVVLGNPDKSPVVYQFTTAFPVGTALAQTWNTELVENVGRAVGEEMKAYGVTYWLAPALNIHRNPLCGRNFEYYSEDPLISGKMAAAMTKGVQNHRGCYVTLKHFCCNNQEDNRNKTNANVSERALREIYLRGFEIAVRESHPGAIMSSYNKVNGVYVNNSYDFLTKVLRNEWGFDGLVMTDWFATGKGLGSHAFAIKAGNDLIMPGGAGAENAIYHAVQSGLIKEADVKRCAANVLKGIVSSRIYQAFKKSRK